MARQPYAPKPSAAAAIRDGLAELGIDADDAVNVLGFYGEKGVVFFENPAELASEGATLGFTLISKDLAPKHYNASDGAMLSLAELIINALGVTPEVEDVEITTTVQRVVLR